MLVRSQKGVLSSVVRSYRDHFFMFLMRDAQEPSHILLFVYCIGINQHNALVLTKDFSEQFRGESEQLRISLADADGVSSTLAVVTNKQISTYKVEYFNRLTLNKENRERLVRWCKEIKADYDEKGVLMNSPVLAEVV